MTMQEDMQHLQREIERLKEENTQLKAMNGLSQMPEPSDLEVDPLFLKIKQQLVHLQDANIISHKAMELTQQSEQALSALIPALEVQFHGMNNQIEQLKASNVDLENTYVMVVEKLEKQLKALKQQLSSQENRLEDRLDDMARRQNQLEQALQLSQQRNEEYRARIDQMQQQALKDEAERNPFKSLNIFDL